MKALSVQQQLDMVMRAYKWWEAEELPEGKRWRSLVHNGIMFPPSYERHNVKMLYDGQPVELTAKQEEVATFYAQIAPDGPQLGNEETAETFNANFFKDFQAVLGKDHVIKDFAKCDFTPIRSHLETMRDAKKQMTKVGLFRCCRCFCRPGLTALAPCRRRRRRRRRRGRSRRASTSTRSWTGTCRRCVWRGAGAEVGDFPECGDSSRSRAQVGNVTVEPPGLFRGRGVHPKMGVVKERVMPGSITISISEDAVPARCPVPGHAWKDVRGIAAPLPLHLRRAHPFLAGRAPRRRHVAGLLERERDERHQIRLPRRLLGLQGQVGPDQVREGAQAVQVHRQDPVGLHPQLGRARAGAVVRGRRQPRAVCVRVWLTLCRFPCSQLATAMWVIDKLALRVGNEKDEDEADTVGACSLRLEHITFQEPCAIELDFLGKDSMRHHQHIDVRGTRWTGRHSP